jgi:hypothetical protein
MCSGSRGNCPRITRGFSTLIFLIYYCILAVYVADVFFSSPVASSRSIVVPAVSLLPAPLNVLRVVL